MYPKNTSFFIRSLFWGKRCVGCQCQTVDSYTTYIRPFLEKGKTKTVDSACSCCKKAYFKYYDIFEKLSKLHHVTSKHTFLRYELIKLKNNSVSYAKQSIRVLLWGDVVLPDSSKKEGFIFSIPFSSFFSKKMVAYIKYKWVIYTNRMSMIMQHFKR